LENKDQLGQSVYTSSVGLVDGNSSSNAPASDGIHNQYSISISPLYPTPKFISNTASKSTFDNILADRSNNVVMINFDDGHKSQLIYAKPILDKYGFKASFFLICGTPCTVNALFCAPFTKAYEQSYKYNIPYWLGVKAGNKYADLVIDICTQKNQPNFGFLEHHTAQYKKGFLDGYGDSVASASNANGTYRHKGCHR
jgi:Polysaccharide deacetylase